MSARFLCLLVFGCTALAQTPSPEPRFDVWFCQHADPKAELAHNVARGDTRFLCIGLIGLTCPGSAAEWRMAKHGTRIIQDAGDVPRSEEHMRAIYSAKDYAGAYNELLLEWLKAHE